MSVSDRYIPVSAAASSLRLIYGPNAAKKIAREFDVAVVTAKTWLAGRIPAGRERQIALALIAECDRVDALIAETRKNLAEVANAESGAVARNSTDRRRPLARRTGGPQLIQS